MLTKEDIVDVFVDPAISVKDSIFICSYSDSKAWHIPPDQLTISILSTLTDDLPERDFNIWICKNYQTREMLLHAFVILKEEM